MDNPYLTKSSLLINRDGDLITGGHNHTLWIIDMETFEEKKKLSIAGSLIKEAFLYQDVGNNREYVLSIGGGN